MKSRNKKISIAAFIIGILAIIVFILQPITIRVISFNDFHAALDDKKEVGISKFISAIKQEIIPNTTLILSAGDNFTGDSLSNVLYGKPVAEAFKNINVAASAIGNREFDWGRDKISMWDDMGIDFISANILLDDGYLTKPYIIKNINGIKVAIIGLTTLETKYKVAKKNIEGLDFVDPVKAAQDVIGKLENRDVDLIILLTHIGTIQNENTKEIKFENENLKDLTKIKGVNAIITGHYHLLVNGYVNGVPVVQSWYNGRAINIIDFKINRLTKKLKETKVYSIILDKNNLREDRETLKILKKYNEEASLIFGNTISRLDYTMMHGNEGISPLGAFICNILNKETNADVTIINGGSIRDGLYSGEVTLGDIYRVMPFDSLGVKLKMSGRDVKEVIKLSKDKSMQFCGLDIDKLDDARQITVLINDFMLNSGDKYDFSKGTVIEELDSLRNIFINVLSKY